MVKENWFNLAIAIVAIAVIVFMFDYEEKKYSTEKRLQIFKICINTVDPDVLRNFQALKANIELCEKLSNEFK